MNNFETTIELETRLARYFNPRINLIVPNVSWGIGIHECDLLIVTNSNYLWEVEIKISKSDLMKDFQKKHRHIDNRIKRFYFGIPEKLESYIGCIPKDAGIIIVNQDGYIRKIREAQNRMANKITDEEKFHIAKLGSMRIWNLKEKIISYQNKRQLCWECSLPLNMGYRKSCSNFKDKF